MIETTLMTALDAFERLDAWAGRHPRAGAALAVAWLVACILLTGLVEGSA